jgi:hypothetical protein
MRKPVRLELPRNIEFVAVHNCPEESMRAYVHSFGLPDFGGSDLQENSRLAIAHLIEVIRTPGVTDTMAFSGARVGSDCQEYLLAAFWNNQNTPMIDFFRVLQRASWPGNPEFHSYTFERGIYKPDAPVTCGDGRILLGREEEYKRKTKNLAQYLAMPKFKGKRLIQID